MICATGQGHGNEILLAKNSVKIWIGYGSTGNLRRITMFDGFGLLGFGLLGFGPLRFGLPRGTSSGAINLANIRIGVDLGFPRGNRHGRHGSGTRRVFINPAKSWIG